jgi:hypothetical protein
MRKMFIQENYDSLLHLKFNFGNILLINCFELIDYNHYEEQITQSKSSC